MAAPSEVDSMHDNMTRIRLKMVQRKLANEKEKLQRPDSSGSESTGDQFKLQQALLRRQQLLDRLKLEQAQEESRARSASPRLPRRRYTASTLIPPSRRSLPLDLLRGVSRSYPLNLYASLPRGGDMVPSKYIIEHQYPQPQPIVARRQVDLPPVYQVPVVAPAPQITHIQAPTPVVQHVPSVTYLDSPTVKCKESPFNKADFMDMMMLQNAQMHHMVMQQMMLQHLPGGGSFRLPTAQVPLAPVRAAPMMMSAPPAPFVHHVQNLPPLEPRVPSNARVYNNAAMFNDNGSNYFTYH